MHRVAAVTSRYRRYPSEKRHEAASVPPVGNSYFFTSTLLNGRQRWTQSIPRGRISLSTKNTILTLARASTSAPFLRSILIISVWFALAAKCNGVSPLTVGMSGQASCCSKKITIFMHPMKLATCNGVSPDCGEQGTCTLAPHDNNRRYVFEIRQIR